MCGAHSVCIHTYSTLYCTENFGHAAKLLYYKTWKHIKEAATAEQCNMKSRESLPKVRAVTAATVSGKGSCLGLYQKNLLPWFLAKMRKLSTILINIILIIHFAKPAVYKDLATDTMVMEIICMPSISIVLRTLTHTLFHWKTLTARASKTKSLI